MYPSNYKNTEFSNDEDNYLLFLTFNYGYGNWEDIIKAIRLSEEFMFNYFFKSRDKSEIQRRIDYLVKLLEREYTEVMSQQKPLISSEERNKKKRSDEILEEGKTSKNE